MKSSKPNQTCHLYRHFDKSGNILYIGVSVSILHRILQHRNNSTWFPGTGNITIEEFPSRSLAEQAERIAIRKEQPPHNVVHKVVHKEKPRSRIETPLYKKWVEGEWDWRMELYNNYNRDFPSADGEWHVPLII